MFNYNPTPITQLVPGTQVLATDVYPAVDTTDLTQSPSGSTKKYTVAQLQSFITTVVSGSNVMTAYVSSTTNLVAVYVNNPSGMNPGVGATLTNAGTFGPLVLDGITVTVGMRLLIPFQSNNIQNGVFDCVISGNSGTAWQIARVADFDGNPTGKINQGDFVGVLFGNTYGLSFFFETSPNVVNVGTDPITFERETNPIQLPWVIQTSSSTNLIPNTGYTTNAGVTQVSYSLPTSCPVGGVIQICGLSSGSYQILQNLGQGIIMGSSMTTIGTSGRLTPVNSSYSLVLSCIMTNTLFQVTSSTGPFDLV